MSRRTPMTLSDTYRGKRILVTGHTGFKGTWLCLWLENLGAKVFGYSLDVEPGSLYERAEMLVPEACSHPGEPAVPGRSLVSPIEDGELFAAAVAECKPALILHLAAQAIVSVGHEDPVGTFQTNVQGTVSVLEAARRHGVPALVVTSDKVYRPRESGLAVATVATAEGFTEWDPLGGSCPYSASKAAADMATQAYRASFGVHVAVARAGNVVGGGDYGKDRLIPDAVRARLGGHTLTLRNPTATRPYQHVLDCLYGYLLLGERMLTSGTVSGAWNFGPQRSLTTLEVVEAFDRGWGSEGRLEVHVEPLHRPYIETRRLSLDATKALRELGWVPLYSPERAVEKAARWYRDVAEGADVRLRTLAEIMAYEAERSAIGWKDAT